MDSPGYEPLSAQDASFVFFEHRAAHMHVAALAIFEVGPLRSASGAVDAARLARYGESQLGQLPRYRQKLAFVPLSGRPVWVDDPHFDLDYHLRHTALPPPGGAEELKRLVGRVLSQPLDRDRRLWEMWLVEAFEGDRFALLMKVHHCMIDGVAAASLLTRLFRPDPDASIPHAPAWRPRQAPSPLRLVLAEAVDRASTPLALTRAAAEALHEPGRTLRRARERTASVAEALRGALHLPSASVRERSGRSDRIGASSGGIRPRADQGGGTAARRHGERRRARDRGRRHAALPRAPRRAAAEDRLPGGGAREHALSVGRAGRREPRLRVLPVAPRGGVGGALRGRPQRDGAAQELPRRRRHRLPGPARRSYRFDLAHRALRQHRHARATLQPDREQRARAAVPALRAGRAPARALSDAAAVRAAGPRR